MLLLLLLLFVLFASNFPESLVRIAADIIWRKREAPTVGTECEL
jgi:hypothetical protein